MRLAFSPSSPGLTPGELLELTAEAEGLGYEAAWVAEVSGAEAMGLCGAIAARTERMELGVAVVPAATRSPPLLAMGAATVSSLLAGRRFSLGIGASSATIVERWHDRPFEPPLARVEEAVAATRALLTGERSFKGSTVTVDRFRLGVAPAGPIALYVGALGPRMLRLAGATGDGVCLNLMTVEVVARQLQEIERGADAAGREWPTGDFGVMARFHTVVSDDKAIAREVIRTGFGPYFAQPVYNRFLSWMGYEEEAGAIAAAFAEGDREGVAAAFHDDLVDSVALVGSAADVRQRLDAYADAGVGTAALNFVGMDVRGIGSALAALAP